MAREKNITSVICHSVLAEVGPYVFDNLNDHMFCSSPDVNHIFSLTTLIVRSYCKVRFHHLTRQTNEKLKDESKDKQIRKTFTKFIMFAGQ